MRPEEIRSKVKEILSKVAGIDPATIADDASLVDDLGLDSLSVLEVGVEVDYTFRLGLPEDRLEALKTVEDAVELVLEKVGQQGAVA